MACQWSDTSSCDTLKPTEAAWIQTLKDAIRRTSHRGSHTENFSGRECEAEMKIRRIYVKLKQLKSVLLAWRDIPQPRPQLNPQLNRRSFFGLYRFGKNWTISYSKLRNRLLERFLFHLCIRWSLDALAVMIAETIELSSVEIIVQQGFGWPLKSIEWSEKRFANGVTDSSEQLSVDPNKEILRRTKWMAVHCLVRLSCSLRRRSGPLGRQLQREGHRKIQTT